MCNSSSIFFFLPLLEAPVVRPNSQNCEWKLRRIHHPIINFSGKSRVSIHEIRTASFSKSRAQCCIVENDISTELPRESDLIRQVGKNDLRITASRGFKQTTTRSNLVAKQVISIQSALSLGFISQLWVDTTSWLVLVVDIKPSLLSGESERFLLKDIRRVGDVVLVDDETVLDTEFRMVGLETLVGYRVVTTRRRNIGKVRGYSFNINSGIVESLELDSFGITIIPSSLVSTYRLDIEDIIEVLEDIVVVNEAAASRKQRLTKGFWDTQFDSEYSDVEKLEKSSDIRQRRRNNRSNRRKRDLDDEE